MKFTGHFIAPRIDRSRFIREMGEALKDQLALAAFEWLNATAAKIPQWSGASAATFLHLARQVSFSLPVSPSGVAPNRINLGLRTSEGEITIEPDRGRFSFTYSTTLPHLIYNEFNNANIVPDDTLFFRLLQPGPYEFQEKGRAAFLRVAAGVRLPNPIFKVNRIRIG